MTGRRDVPGFQAVQWKVAEKQVERSGDQLMRALGFTPIRFSQPRQSMQTRGIPDRRYYRAGFPPLWWEAKSERGKQSVHQKAFQALVESCGEQYVVGELSALEDWCIEQRLVRRLPEGSLIALRSA